jgi:lipopolysaccharide export LptBFGC system permease protein LptF
MKKINKLPKDYLILLSFIIIACVFTLTMTSCSSRKVAKSEIKEQEQKTEKITLETETRVTDNTKIIDTSTSDEIEISPISDTIPMVINGITYKNVKIKRKKSKNNISVAKDVKVQHKAQKSDLKVVKSNKVVEIKQIEKKQSYWWLLWFLLLIPAYYLWRKYNLSKLFFLFK